MTAALLSRLAIVAEQLRHTQQDTAALATERDNLVRLLHADGFPQTGIAVCAGISRQRINQILDKEGRT